MKRKFFVPLALVFGLIFTTVSAGDDKKAVAEVIEKEYQAYRDKDMEAWSGYWVHEPYAYALWSGANGYDYKKSFDSIQVNVKKWMSGDDQPGTAIEKEIQDILISDDMATVFLKEYDTWTFAGEEKKFKLKSTYILKKVEGDWKFVSMVTFNKTSYDNDDFSTEWAINMEGYRLMWRDELDKAIKVFELNTQLYPEGFNTWDSLAEACMKKGDTEKAVKYYYKSLELNPKNENAKKMIEKIEKGE
jgi:tetratricopeptide (TPR) repeat protein